MSRKYIRRILANMPTVIKPLYPAQKVSRIVNSVGQFWTEITPPQSEAIGVFITAEQAVIPFLEEKVFDFRA